MDPSDDFETLPGLAFTVDDMTTAATWHQRFRLSVMRLGVSGDHQDFPDMLEVSEPWQREVRWSVYRDAVGLVLDDLLDNSRQRLATMEEVLRLIWDTAEADKASAIAAIPETLIPDVGL